MNSTAEIITKYTSPNHGGTRTLEDIKGIAIHHWGDPNAGYTLEGVTAHLSNPNAKDRYGNPAPVSAHLVVTAGQIIHLVDFDEIAWHAHPANYHTIGIECNPRCTPDDFDTVAQAVAYCWKSLGRIVPLYGHKDLNPGLGTLCPGRYYPRLQELHARALEYYHDKTPNHVKKGKKTMLFVYLKDYATGGYKPESGNLYALVAPGFFCRFTGQEQANRFAKEYGSAVEVTSSMWDALAETAKRGSNNAGYRDSVDTDINRIANAVENMGA